MYNFFYNVDFIKKHVLLLNQSYKKLDTNFTNILNSIKSFYKNFMKIPIFDSQLYKNFTKLRVLRLGNDFTNKSRVFQRKTHKKMGHLRLWVM